LHLKGAYMATERTKQHSDSSKAKLAHGAKPKAGVNLKQTTLEVGRSGDWMPAEELRVAALSAVEAANDATLHLGGINHLDASALQILLALDAEQKRCGRRLEVANVSPQLRQWFEYAGAAEQFFLDGVKAR